MSSPQKTKTKTKTKNKEKSSSFITNLKEIKTNPGYYSVNNLHSLNSAASDNNLSALPIISQLLGQDKYFVPSYLSFYGKHNEDEDTTTDEEDTTTDEEDTTDDEEDKKEKKENIIITITPIEKCSNKVVDTDVFNRLVDSAEGHPLHFTPLVSKKNIKTKTKITKRQKVAKKRKTKKRM
jgi:hypothetical protein